MPEKNSSLDDEHRSSRLCEFRYMFQFNKELVTFWEYQTQWSWNFTQNSSLQCF